MHMLLLHGYHLGQLVLQVLWHPLWRAMAACMVVMAAGRLAGAAETTRRRAGLACVAAGIGWAMLDLQASGWPLAPVARLPGLAAVLLAEAVWRGGRRRLVRPFCAALGAWWLRGAPWAGPAILGCMPVFLGLWAGMALAGRLAGPDGGVRGTVAAGALAGALLVTGAAAHWAMAAAVVAVAALGMADAGGALAGAAVMVAASAVVASDRGRLVPVDLACLAPLAVWTIWRR